MNNYFFVLNLSTFLTILLLLQSCSYKEQILWLKSATKIKENIWQASLDIVDRQLDDTEQLYSLEEAGKTKNSLKSIASLHSDKSQGFVNTAKLLAGINLDNDSDLKKLQQRKIWQEHHQAISQSWSQLEHKQLAKMRQWSQTELATVNGDDTTIFYPFSRGDFINVYTLFPKSKEFILVGSQLLGEIPDIENLERFKLNERLEAVRNSLYNLLDFNFLRTKNFDKQLPEKGILDSLYVFLARTNNQIVDLDYIDLDLSGNIQPTANKIKALGVKITFISSTDNIVRYLYYFRDSLTNEEIETSLKLFKLIESKNQIITYLNKASYVMHYDSFSEIRDLILSRSNYLLQDDSGIPVECFDRKHWQLKFYGNYIQPIALFGDRYQPDLRQIYLSKFDLKPLNFSVGYQLDPARSNLMLGKLN